MLGVSAHDKIGVTVDARVRWSSAVDSTIELRRAQASPTRPEQPSLASVGGGMAAGAAFAHPRAAGARVRPIFFTLI